MIPEFLKIWDRIFKIFKKKKEKKEALRNGKETTLGLNGLSKLSPMNNPKHTFHGQSQVLCQMAPTPWGYILAHYPKKKIAF